MEFDAERFKEGIERENLDYNYIRILYSGLTEFEIQEILKYQGRDRLKKENF